MSAGLVGVDLGKPSFHQGGGVGIARLDGVQDLSDIA